MFDDPFALKTIHAFFLRVCYPNLDHYRVGFFVWFPFWMLCVFSVDPTVECSHVVKIFLWSSSRLHGRVWLPQVPLLLRHFCPSWTNRGHLFILFSFSFFLRRNFKNLHPSYVMADGRWPIWWPTSDVGRQASTFIMSDRCNQKPWRPIGFPLAMVISFKFQLDRSRTDIAVCIKLFAFN